MELSNNTKNKDHLSSSEAQIDISIQKEYAVKARKLLQERFNTDNPLAMVRTFGCQQNFADGEKLKGMLIEMGFDITDDVNQAHLIMFNTCAIREHAEDRVFGNVGALKKLKEKDHSKIIALCGCMMQQEHITKRIKTSFPFVNLVFGTHVVYKLPELLYRVITSEKRVFAIDEQESVIVEGIPVKRDCTFKSSITIMEGCNNFCTYCIVPYVRGREKSRKPEDIIAEAKSLIATGCKEITLLGQNVNSYGKNLDGYDGYNFARLLSELNSLPGEFKIRFMTSHPKDITKELIDVIASCDKVCKHIHLPFQSGNDRVVKAMNRHYTIEKYLEIVDYIKEKIPECTLTSDVIVGFPGETYEEFKDTLKLIERVGFHMLYTFIYSPRVGTPAAKMEDPVPYDEKNRWFKELCDKQDEVSDPLYKKSIGKTYTVLVEEIRENGLCTGRNDGNVIVEFKTNDNIKQIKVGEYVKVNISNVKHWVLVGELTK